LETFLKGLELAVQLNVMLALFAGVFLGIIFGAIPGLTSTMGIAILVPLTYGMEPVQGMGMLIGMYIGAIYGGSISAILLNIPGTPSSLVTSLDGYPLAMKGEAGRAMSLATVSSFIGGEIGTICLIFAAPFLAKAALDFGPAEYFALCIFGLSIIANLSGKDLVKGVISAALGLLIVTVGMDPVTSIPRFVFGKPQLMSGLPFLPMLLGLFGFREAMTQIKLIGFDIKGVQKITNIIPKWKDIKEIFPTTLRAGLIGSFIGALPGAGGPIASFISYDTEKRISKNPERFGTGYPRGIAAAESANNAVNGGAFVPMLTLGIPGDGNTAIMLGALMMHNLRPGPLLFQNHGDFVAALYIQNFIGNILILILGLSCLKYFAKIALVPLRVLLPMVTIFCIIGAYSIRNSIFDVSVMIAFGILGYLLSKLNISTMPLVLGLVLGPILEQNMRSALKISGGDWSIFVLKPISAMFLLITLIILIWPFITSLFKKNKVSTDS